MALQADSQSAEGLHHPPCQTLGLLSRRPADRWKTRCSGIMREGRGAGGRRGVGKSYTEPATSCVVVVALGHLPPTRSSKL